MKAIHNSLMALAASLLLAPAAYAQTDTPVQYQHEKYALENGVGFNKYLVSQTPNANSEYTLRLETFVTGGVEATAIPTDFVLVMDNSGSMYYDYRPGNVAMPNRIPLDNTTLLPYFKNDYGAKDPRYSVFVGAAYKRVWTTSTVGVAGGNSYYYDTFTTETGSLNCTRYYKYVDPAKPSNDGYYKIFQRKVGNYFNLAIKLEDGNYRYLYGNTDQATANTTITADNQIIYNGPMYRIQARQEALWSGVESFLQTIGVENRKDQWAEGAVKHQVAMVAFGSGYQVSADDITEHQTSNGNSKVIKDFVEVGDESTLLATAKTAMAFTGSTHTDFGVHLAMKLLQNLETKEGGKYSALNASGGTNRKKVVVLFTDGEPYFSGLNFFQIVKPALTDGKTIKEVGVGKLNGRIYTIDLWMSDSSKDFLGHLSSNYPKGDCTSSSGSYSASKFTGKKLPFTESDVSEDEWEFFEGEQPVYYKDSKDGDMSSVFSSIASANMGQQAGDKLVVMDVMSDSFELPANLSGKVKFYTAQCIGEKEIDGDKYLAFAKEVPVDEREPLAHLWVSHTEGTGAAAHLVWDDQGAAASGGLDIDQEVRAKKSADGKHITVSGFEFVDLWCGKDELAAHYSSATNGNTRQMASDDPNAAYAADGYRGFKLIIEFPIVVSPGAVGGTGVPTNNEFQSGFYHGTNDGTAEGDPIINYQKPALTIPVQLAIQKKGLGPNESANFTIQRRTMVEGSEWTDYLSFVLTSTSDDSEPIQRILNLNPDYYYRVKEEGWSWAYSNRAQVEATFPSTEDPTLTNPIVIVNTPKDDTPKHAEAVVRNELKNY